jgi:hypothetical protein
LPHSGIRRTPDLVSLAAGEYEFLEAQLAQHLDVFLDRNVEEPVASPGDSDADNFSGVAADPKQRPVFTSKET